MLSRADKKKKVAPFLPDRTIMFVRKLAIYRNDSDGDTGCALVLSGMRDNRILGRLAPYFKRDYAIGQTFFHGHHKSHKQLALFIEQYGPGIERLYMRFTRDQYLALDDLAVALGTSYISHIAAAMILLADERIVQAVAPGFIETYGWRREG